MEVDDARPYPCPTKIVVNHNANLLDAGIDERLLGTDPNGPPRCHHPGPQHVWPGTLA